MHIIPYVHRVRNMSDLAACEGQLLLCGSYVLRCDTSGPSLPTVQIALVTHDMAAVENPHARYGT